MSKEKIPSQPVLAEEEAAPREPSALRRILTRIGAALLLILALVFAYVFLLLGEPEEDAKNAAPAIENTITMPMSPFEAPGEANIESLAETFGEHSPQRRVARRLTQDEGVVEVRHDLFVDDALQHPEIHHHPAFRVSFAGRRTSLDGHEKPVGVAVNLTAWPVVSVQSVRRLEGELFCQSDHCHMRKDIH